MRGCVRLQSAAMHTDTWELQYEDRLCDSRFELAV